MTLQRFHWIHELKDLNGFAASSEVTDLHAAEAVSVILSSVLFYSVQNLISI